MCTRKPITKDSPGIGIEVMAEYTALPIEGNAPAGEVERIRKARTSGNAWAWCDVHVRVIYRGELARDAYLGPCSYESEKAFRHDNGAFDDLVEECLVQLNRALMVLCGPEKEGA